MHRPATSAVFYLTTVCPCQSSVVVIDLQGYQHNIIKIRSEILHRYSRDKGKVQCRKKLLRAKTAIKKSQEGTI